MNHGSLRSYGRRDILTVCSLTDQCVLWVVIVKVLGMIKSNVSSPQQKVLPWRFHAFEPKLDKYCIPLQTPYL